MAKLTINRGSTANDGTGDNLRDGANKVNLNFTEIYTAIGDGTTISGTIKVADDSSTVMTLSANGETIRMLGGTGIDTTISGNDITIATNSSVLTASQVSTLTNKSIALGSNTITGTTAEFNTALTDNDFATLAGTEALTNKTVAIGSNTITGTALTITGDDSSTTSLSIGDNILFTGGSGITTSISGNEITFATDGAVVTETSTDTLTNKTISGSTNTLSNIGNSSLTNSSITLGDDSISLGGTQTTVTNLSLDGATGTIDLTSSGNKLRFNYAGTGSFPSEVTYEGMFAYDTTGNEAYVADSGGWTKLINENASVGDLSNVNITGVANGQALIWSSAQGRFNPGDVSVSTSTYEDTAVRFDVSANGSSAYRFGHYGSTDNPTIYAKQGQTIAFDLTSLSNEHPFVLQTSSGSTYVSGNRITTGLTHVATDGTVTTGVNAQGKTSGVLYFEVPSDQITIYYICSSHGAMNGTLYIRQKIPSVQKYTGNGSTTAYTITAGKVVDDILVFVNGICLVPTDDYTISGTTLTMATAPANSAEITIRYL